MLFYKKQMEWKCIKYIVTQNKKKKKSHFSLIISTVYPDCTSLMTSALSWQAFMLLCNEAVCRRSWMPWKMTFLLLWPSCNGWASSAFSWMRYYCYSMRLASAACVRVSKVCDGHSMMHGCTCASVSVYRCGCFCRNSSGCCHALRGKQ